MNLQNTRELYQKLLQQVLNANIEIKQLNNLPQDSKYQYRRKLGGAQISVYRNIKDNGLVVKADKIEEFMDRGQDLDEELVCIAHEFGHHFSPDLKIDRLYNDVRARKPAGDSIAEGARIFVRCKGRWRKFFSS